MIRNKLYADFDVDPVANTNTICDFINKCKEYVLNKLTNIIFPSNDLLTDD